MRHGGKRYANELSGDFWDLVGGRVVVPGLGTKKEDCNEMSLRAGSGNAPGNECSCYSEGTPPGGLFAFLHFVFSFNWK
jgi:hypothetical protein